MFNTYKVSGTRYEMGYKLGELFNSPINTNINRFIDMLKNEDIKNKLEKAIALIKEKMPECLDELYGKADGAKVDRDALVLMHYPEIYTEPYSCTTAIYKKNDRVLFSHNEDDVGFDNDNVAIVKYEYQDHFVVTLTLYNRLAGSCFGYNSYGLVFSCNYLFHNDENLDNLSRYIVSRKLIEAKTIKECLDIIDNNKPAQPFSFNVLDINSNEVINVENDIEDKYITQIDGKYSRSNHFLNKENPKMSENSKYRYLHSKEGIMKAGEDANLEDVIKVLKYEDKEYVKSVLMDPLKYPDINNSVTMANFAFDSKTKEIIITDYFDHSTLKLDYNF